MEESVKSDARLEVSVSFGRFESDALSWEKWSAFSPNKYLEEVGSLSTPGSVAQKKAYFEAHYKKIAARKAEELEQEKSLDLVIPSPDVANKEDRIENSLEADEICASNDQRLAEEVSQESSCITVSDNATVADETRDDNATSSEGLEQGGACADGLIDVITSQEKKEEAKDEFNGNIVDPELNVKDEAASHKKPQKILEKPRERKRVTEQPSVLKKENSKANAQNITPKVTPAKKERNLAGTKKQVVSPAAKPLQTSTPRSSKPASSSTPISSSQTLMKKVNGSPLPKRKNFVGGESKRAASTSLHMSLNLGPAKSVCNNVPITRKSLIMEQMGDKDIVKRAFKTFQNRTYVSSNNAIPSAVKHVSSTSVKPNISNFHTPTKGNERLRKEAEKMATPRSQSGARSNPLPSGSYKSSATERKSRVASSPAVNSRSDEKAERRKEFLKKLEAKSIAREAENARLGLKSKDQKESNVEKHRQSINFKAKPKEQSINFKAKPKESSYQGQAEGHLGKV